MGLPEEGELIIYEGSEVEHADLPEGSKEDKKDPKSTSFSATAHLKKDATGNHVLELQGKLQLDTASIPFDFKGSIALNFEQPLVIQKHECCQCGKAAATNGSSLLGAPPAPTDQFSTPASNRFEPRGNSYDPSPSWGGGVNSYGGRSPTSGGGGFRGGRGGGRGGGGGRPPRGDDWNCNCGISNFAFRTECFKCKAPKPSDGGSSGGGGGSSNFNNHSTVSPGTGGGSWGSGGGGGGGGGGGSWGSNGGGVGGGGGGGGSWGSNGGGAGGGGGGGSWGSGGGGGAQSNTDSWGPPSGGGDSSESRGWGRGGGKRSNDFDSGNDYSNKRFRSADFGGQARDTSAYKPHNGGGRTAHVEDSWE